MDNELDPVFRALADPQRRRIVDLLAARPGMTASELTEHFEMTRFGVRKHLIVLESANLITQVWERPSKRLYLNPIPIQMIYDRWIHRYSRFWGSHLTALKYSLENAEQTRMEQTQVYVIYIRTTLEKLWQALTEPALSRQYFMGCDVQSDFKAGSPIRYVHAGELRVEGKIVEVQPPSRLVHTFIAHMESGPSEESTVTYQMEPAGDSVKLTVTHSGYKTDALFEATREGWPVVISYLKSLLETGKGAD